MDSWFRVESRVRQIHRIEEIAHDLAKDAPDRAMDLEVALKACNSWHYLPAGNASSGNVAPR